ncbi:MAG TPA: Clp protease N-terminal domain-containing protein [Dongiaceae bacterium]|nr:Clp protease N-terminal domain-containing protein [Dongiaceae bacterium]
MWEPFTEGSRRAVVRAQEVAQMFGNSFIGNEHLAFALAETDDDVGHLLANALDRDAIRARLGTVRNAPPEEMVFTSGAKRTIEMAFENARRLNHNYIGSGHLALGMLDSEDAPPLLPGCDLTELRTQLARGASAHDPVDAGWKQTAGPGFEYPARQAMLSALAPLGDVSRRGTRVTITIAPPDGEARTWSWTREG